MTKEKIDKLFSEEEKAGEQKVNIIRLSAIAVFFADEMLNYYLLGAVEPGIHARTIWTLVAWELFAFATWHHVNLRGSYARWMKYASTGVDVLFLTFIIIALEANSGPLISLYYLLIAHSALHYSGPRDFRRYGAFCRGLLGSMVVLIREPAHTAGFHLCGGN
jgi:hypothetical protein